MSEKKTHFYIISGKLVMLWKLKIKPSQASLILWKHLFVPALSIILCYFSSTGVYSKYTSSFLLRHKYLFHTFQKVRGPASICSQNTNYVAMFNKLCICSQNTNYVAMLNQLVKICICVKIQIMSQCLTKYILSVIMEREMLLLHNWFIVKLQYS